MESNQVDTTSAGVSEFPPATCYSLQQPSDFPTAYNYSNFPPNAFQSNLHMQPLNVSGGVVTVGYIAPATNQSTAAGAPVVEGLVAQPAVLTSRYEQVTSYKAHAILAWILFACCPVSGIIAAHLAGQAQSKETAGDKAGARKFGNISLAVSLSTIVVMVLVIVIVVPVMTVQPTPKCNGYKDASGTCYKYKTFTGIIGCSWAHFDGHYESGYCYYN